MGETSAKELSVVVTMNCDSKCRHCYIDSQAEGTVLELSAQTWCSVLDWFQACGGELFIVHGGEPLLYRGIQALLAHARELTLKSMLITNAIHLTPEMVNVLRSCGTYVLVSLDGPEDNYLRVRGSEKLPDVVASVDALLDAGVTVHPIHMVHAKNVYDLSWIVELARSRSIPRVTLSPIQPCGRASQNSELLLSCGDLHRFVDRLHELNCIHEGEVQFVTQSLYRPEDEAKYLKDEEALRGEYETVVAALNDGTWIPHFDLPEPRAFAFGSVLDPDSLRRDAVDAWRDFTSRAYRKGLEELRAGRAINWYEVMQRLFAAEHNSEWER